MARRRRVPALMAVAALAGCYGSLNLSPSDADVVLAHQVLDAPSPAIRGEFAVARLYYGSGEDKRRAEYRDSVAIVTEPVDASKLVDPGSSAKSRNSYWGFTPKEFPLNGRVWYPKGDGPFPLVLMVHGNHNPRDFSDPGYGYLGELLASRGYITVSVDMNFLNGSIRGENDARGWMLLKHLEAWRSFNETEDNPFFAKVDMDRIALIGHSRGGEAVGHAAAFNRLTHYPDDANVTFDFDFAIQSIIAIAPVDGQYLPTGRYVPIEDVNYLVFHGSHDGDVTSFHGLRTYHRVRFTDGSPRLKAAVYMYRANHGQWNTVWNDKDRGPRSGRILDLRALVDPEEQRLFGKMYISAFLEATLKGDKRYLPIFRDHRVIGGWLPKTMYITRFQTDAFRPLATFEEDIDVTTGTFPGVSLRGDSLGTWREDRLDLRSQNRPTTSGSQLNQAVWLGWNNRIGGGPDSVTATPATYTVTLPDTLAAAWRVGRGWTLDFLLAPTTEKPSPRSPADTAAAKERSAGAEERDRQDTEREQETDEPRTVDLTVEIIDLDGESAALELGRYGQPRMPLDISILRRKDRERDRFANLWELVLQSYSIPLGDFVEANPELDLSAICQIRFVFGRTPAGTVVVDDIGLSDLDPAYTRVAVPWEGR